MKVVIVDDVQMNITLLQHLVRKLADCEAHAFTDPHQALAWCQDGDPDLIVTDYMMPGLNGIELVQRLHERLPHVPTLMITANHEKELRHEALQAGVTDFLNKPLDNTEFLARARNMLALSASRRKLADRAQWLADEVAKATEDLARQSHEAILCLSRAAEHRDNETGAHIRRMSLYSRHIARCLGLPLADQELLQAAAPMHDVGKVGTPDLILLKPGPLTAEEFEVMKRHTVIGWEVLSAGTSPLMKEAARIAYTHHERFDGTGYPRGLAGTDIPLFGRIVAVADVFDALTSARPYKRSWSIERSLALLEEGRGKHFDPACVDAFLQDWDEVLAIKQQFTDEPVAEVTPETVGSIR